MIARFLAFLLVLYALGFALFAVTLARPADASAPKVDAIVVITGGKGRIERGVELLSDGVAKRMFISGVDPSVRKVDLIERLGGKRRLFDCCVDLGSESVDTRSNADESKRWLDRHDYKAFRLVTSDWHMHRALYEFRRELGKDYTIVPDPVRTQPNFGTLFAEYNKYLLRRLSIWLDI